MRFDLVTIFPDFFRGPLEHGILRRAQDSGIVEIRVQDLREFAHDRHRTVDDRPFGGGEGMVLKPEPLFAAVEHLLGPAAVGADLRLPRDQSRGVRPLEGDRLSASGGHGFSRAETTTRAAGGPSSLPQAAAQGEGPERNRVWQTPNVAIILLSASGKLFRQQAARRFAQLDRIILLCGRYEGVDERVAAHLATDELSIGDFVLSGGELAAALILDAVTRLLPGALGNQDSTANESFSCSGDLPVATTPNAVVPSLQSQVPSPGILDFPHYTRPADFRGWRVPDVLISGHHADVRRWRRKVALAKTLRNRPELLAAVALSDDDRALLREAQSETTDAQA